MGTKRSDEFRADAVGIDLTSGLMRRQVVSDLVMGPHGIHQEPGPAADDGHVAKGDGSDPGASRGRAAAVGRAFLG